MNEQQFYLNQKICYETLVSDLCSIDSHNIAGGPIKIKIQRIIQKFSITNKDNINEELRLPLINLVQGNYSMCDGSLLKRSIEIKDVIIKAVAKIMTYHRLLI